MADDKNQGAGRQTLAPEVLAARAAEQRERDDAAFAEREYDLARQAAAANAAGRAQPHGFDRNTGQQYFFAPVLCFLKLFLYCTVRHRSSAARSALRHIPPCLGEI